MSSIHELLKQVYPLKLRMELFNAIWFNWQADIKEKDQQITDLEAKLAESEKEQNQKAIEQLEKIKELCKNKFEWWENSEWDGNIYDKSDVSNAYFDIEANIDQQIASLKKGV